MQFPSPGEDVHSMPAIQLTSAISKRGEVSRYEIPKDFHYWHCVHGGLLCAVDSVVFDSSGAVNGV